MGVFFLLFSIRSLDLRVTNLKKETEDWKANHNGEGIIYSLNLFM